MKDIWIAVKEKSMLNQSIRKCGFDSDENARLQRSTFNGQCSTVSGPQSKVMCSWN